MFQTDWNQFHQVALYFQNHRSNNQSKVTEDMHLNDQPAVSCLCLPVYVTAKVYPIQTELMQSMSRDMEHEREIKEMISINGWKHFPSRQKDSLNGASCRAGS